MRRHLCLAGLLAASAVMAAGQTVDSTYNYKLVNKASGLVLGIAGASQQAGAGALQWTDNGTPDHLWHLIPSVGVCTSWST